MQEGAIKQSEPSKVRDQSIRASHVPGEITGDERANVVERSWYMSEAMAGNIKRIMKRRAILAGLRRYFA